MNKDARVDVGLPDHPKTLQLERALGADGPWGLVRLWLWAAKHRTTGDLSGLADADLEAAIRWRGQPGKLMSALRECRFVEGGEFGSLLHDWSMHNSYAFESRERTERSRLGGLAKKHGIRKARKILKNRESAARLQPEREQQASSTGLFSAPSPSPSPTHYGKEGFTPSGRHANGHGSPFERFWDAYPRKVGKLAAARAWGKLAPTPALLDRILAAVLEHSASDQWIRDAGRFIPHPATWLNGRRWDDEATDRHAGTRATIDKAEAIAFGTAGAEPANEPH